MVQIKTVGVIGAGQMGSGIAHVCALGGYDVVLHDVSRDRINAGVDNIERNMTRQVQRGLIRQEEMEASMQRIKGAEELQEVGQTDLAIEAATEDGAEQGTQQRRQQRHLSSLLVADPSARISGSHALHCGSA